MSTLLSPKSRRLTSAASFGLWVEKSAEGIPLGKKLVVRNVLVGSHLGVGSFVSPPDDMPSIL
jgi:hypothetical protein